MTYTKDLNLLPGDRIRITSPYKEPFPPGWAEGKVITAYWYDDGGWYIELEKDNVSYGWETGYGYFKEKENEVTIELLTVAALVEVEPKYSDNIMERVRLHLGLESNDTSRDVEINGMTHDSVFQHCLEWEGIIGYDISIHSWIKEIYDVVLH